MSGPLAVTTENWLELVQKKNLVGVEGKSQGQVHYAPHHQGHFRLDLHLNTRHHCPQSRRCHRIPMPQSCMVRDQSILRSLSHLLHMVRGRSPSCWPF
eukprot:scaffold262795_cov58-Attheya_sp.AAC.2